MVMIIVRIVIMMEVWLIIVSMNSSNNDSKNS